jgi:hypothetical protein
MVWPVKTHPAHSTGLESKKNSSDGEGFSLDRSFYRTDISTRLPNFRVAGNRSSDETICERGKSMSREQKVAAVEAYLDCFVTKDLSKVSFAEDVTFEGPRIPKLTGQASILGFLAHILPLVKGIQLKQHIVEGDHVATIFEMETVNGVDHVCDWIHIVDGQIKAIRAFYYSA